ncbi:MSMEG_4193 family putative phosphomutase [Cellulomonas sp. PhB143]|uniref:MSMEG_4193 family putative phosphomutase n=1 Tax=Cellulomonas sp. PhB143 TaxID=2485186 RepID=UPI000F4A619D|nr:MSMEG_4193 family putative phosphomutase [Cellulomonas sp. PhB143]ROS74452.1 putative phosphomutase (TIGR03848 family) [Cellulomonas sp. PhB143]
MPTVLLVRHGRTTANAQGLLAGRAPGVSLDPVGRRQAVRAAERMSGVPLARVVTSPLERCRRTGRILVEHQDRAPEWRVEAGITECDYGRWQGRALRDLVNEPLWAVVQTQPSAATFPGGESLAAVQARSVGAVRRHDADVAAQHGPGAIWAAVAHGDVIKAVLADALGMHLDVFQRIVVGPASVSVVRYGPHRPEVVATNTDCGDLSWLSGAAPAGDAPVGGGSGPPRPGDEDDASGPDHRPQRS